MRERIQEHLYIYIYHEYGKRYENVSSGLFNRMAFEWRLRKEEKKEEKIREAMK